MSADENALKKFRITRIAALAMLVIAPVIYPFVAWLLVTATAKPPAGGDLLFYILLIVGAVSPLLFPLVAKAQIIEFRKKPRDANDWAGLFFTLNVQRLAIVESSFIYGLVVYFLTHSFERMACFYAIGIIWAVVYWPRREKFEGFVQRGDQSL